MKMSYAYFKNCASRALDIAPTLDVPALFMFFYFSVFFSCKNFYFSCIYNRQKLIYATRINGYAELKNKICLINVNWIHRK